MPLDQIRELNKEAFLGLWRITENPEQLASALAILAPALPIPTFESRKRTREWLASRLLAYTLLQKFTPTYHPLVSDENGKPEFVSSPCRLSISHSGDMAAVIISSKQDVGIDLELMDTRLVKLSPKFLSDRELEAAEGHPEILCVYWSAKETMYKLYGKKKLVFKEHLKVEGVPQGPNGQLTAKVVSPTSEAAYTISHEKINDYILTYCLSQEKEFAP